jgi:hypothetical protein
MISSGGAGTHYGVLYQALGTLDATLGIASQGNPSDPKAITLIVVEPWGGGGDMAAKSGTRRTFFQFKARGDHRTWSLNELLDDALSDLYRAVQPELEDCCEYLLVTEGREGRIEEARQFFRSLSRDSVPADPLGTLDDMTRRQFFPSGPQMTNRTFLDHVTHQLTAEKEPTVEAYRRVWSLLSRFDIRQHVFEDLRRSVERRLLGYVDAPEDVTGKARELYGILLELAAYGPKTFTPKSLLSRAGLPDWSLAEIRSAQAAAHARLKTTLLRLGVDAHLLVDRCSTFAGQDVFCIAGESGAGKTTLAGQLALRRSEIDVVVFVSSRQGIKSALNEVADEVWKRVLEHGRPLDWESLVSQARRVGLTEGEPWLTVVLDVTVGAGELESFLRLEWSEWNVRLLFTADKSAGERIQNDSALSHQVGLQLLGDLSFEERYDLLKKRGRGIAEIPGDVIALLARPILADLYCKIDTDPNWHPQNEYQLLDRFWSHAELDQEGRRHRENLSALLQLGELLVDGGKPYPWPVDVLHRQAIDDRVLQRLIERNWLRELDGNFEFAHDRFANWAIARVVTERVRRGKWPGEDLARFLDAIYSRARRGEGSGYGYVPMDALWLLARQLESRRVTAETLLELRHRDWNGFITIGASIVPALYDFSRACEPHSAARARALEAVRAIAEQQQVPEHSVAEWLGDTSDDIHRTGLAIARSQPQTGLLDLLWRLERAADALPDKHAQSHWKYDSTLRATLIAVRSDPIWIREATRKAGSTDELSTIVWMLSMIGDDRGSALWYELKSTYLQAFGEKGVRGVIQCIDRYGDREEITTLIRWIQDGENFIPAEALAALAAISPVEAFKVVEQRPIERVESLASFWLRPLELADDERTRSSILGRFEEKHLSPAWLHWEMRGETQADAVLIRAVADRLIAIAIGALEKPRPERPPVEIEHLLATLGAVNSVQGFDVLRRGLPDLANVLLRLAEWYTPHDASTYERWFVRHIRQVLLRIGGEPLERFVSLQLTKPGDWPEADIRGAVTSPSDAVLSLLRRLATTSSAADEDRIQSMSAIRAIAALGDRNVVFQVMEQNDHLWIDDEIFALLACSPPAEDEQVLPVLRRVPIGAKDRLRRYRLLSITQRPDVVERMIDEFLAEEDEDVKTAALYAICQLSDSSVSVAKALQIGFDEEPEGVARILYAIGSNAALDRLECLLLSVDASTMSEDLVETAAALVNYHGRDALANQVCESARQPRRRYRLDTDQVYRAMGRAKDPEAVETLHQAAFAEGDGRYGAIVGLAHQRPQTAFDAAAAALVSADPDRGDYAQVLIDLDAQGSTSVLCQRLLIERSARVRKRICRALRTMQRDDSLQRRIRVMLSSTGAVERAAGCQVAGWFDDFEDALLRKAAVSDCDGMVRAFALDAVQMHRHHKRVAELLVELRKASGDRAWALLEMILDSGSPLLLTNPHDVLWLDGALEGKLPAMRLYANRRLNEYFESEKREKDDVFEKFYR